MRNAPISYEAIVSVTRGDAEAITVVLGHYKNYIAALSTRTLYDENRLPYVRFDDEMRRRLEAKLIARILHFDASRPITPLPHHQKAEDRYV